MNNSLTLYLALLGGLVLAAFVAHGAWTARKNAARHPRRAALEPMGTGTIDRSEADTIPTEMGDTVPGEPTAEELTSGAMNLPPPVKRNQPRLDALIDAIATLTVDTPVSGDNVLLHLPTTRRAGSKPFMIEGLRVDCGEWEAPQAGVIYGELQAGVLLANRTGGLNEIEYSEFVQKVQACADAMGASAEFPDMLDIVARAKELDGFASAHDAQLALRLYAQGSAWSIGYVQQQAARHGFLPGALPGRFVLPSTEEGAPPVLTLQFDAQAAFAEDQEQATLRELSLSFDVPQTSAEGEPFKAWCAAGQALSLGLDALMADDQGQPFSPAAFASIEGELQRLYEALAARDLAAGSAAARRLFS
ncbi:cell division protein FtsZ [Aquabacterium sp.]|uniref:cell division protein FtsZ n=1 Tax=Aquabacterium sp. TaxID=1872578 RepID=UPI003D6C9AE3